MLVSTKGRYALSVMIDLAEHNSGEFIPLVDIADRQDISEKYLESIVSKLSRADLVESLRGKGGGYRLIRQPELYSVYEILNCTETSLEAVSDVSSKRTDTAIASEKVVNMWKGLDEKIVGYLKNVTLDELVDNGGMYDFVI